MYKNKNGFLEVKWLCIIIFYVWGFQALIKYEYQLHPFRKTLIFNKILKLFFLCFSLYHVSISYCNNIEKFSKIYYITLHLLKWKPTSKNYNNNK